MSLLPVENVYTKTETVKSDLYNILGDGFTFYKVLPFTDTNFGNYSISHIWGNLGYYNEISYNTTNKSITSGGLLDTMLADLPKSFYSKGMIIGIVNNDDYRVELNGYNIGLRIPLNSSYSGMTSGLTATTLYSSFVYEPGILDISVTNLCDGTKADSQTQESNYIWTSNVGIGAKYNSTSEMYKSGVVYLFSDDIYYTFTGGTGSSISWGYQFGVDNKYSKGARLANPSKSQTLFKNTYDRAVGMLHLQSGIFYLWDENIVDGFNWTNFTGNQLTGATTTSGNTYAVVGDIDTSVSLKVDIISKPSDWNSTTNPSAIGEDCGTVFTSICLYDNNGNLLGVAKANEAIQLSDTNYTPLTLELPISGAINDDVNAIWSSGLIAGYELGA